MPILLFFDSVNPDKFGCSLIWPPKLPSEASVETVTLILGDNKGFPFSLFTEFVHHARCDFRCWVTGIFIVISMQTGFQKFRRLVSYEVKHLLSILCKRPSHLECVKIQSYWLDWIHQQIQVVYSLCCEGILNLVLDEPPRYVTTWLDFFLFIIKPVKLEDRGTSGDLVLIDLCFGLV